MDRAACIAFAALLVLLPLTYFFTLAQPPVPFIVDLYQVPGLYLSDLALAPFIVLRAVRIARHSREGAPGPHLRHFLPLLLIAIFGFASLATALYPSLAGYTAVRWLLVAVFAAAIASGPFTAASFAPVLLAAMCANALIGFGQVLARGPIGLPAEAALPALQPGAAVVVSNGARLLRAYGMTYHPNVLGGLLAMALILALPLLERPAVRIGWWLCWLGLLLTFSRSAWLAVAVFLPVSAFWLGRTFPSLRRPLWNTFGIAALLALAWAVPAAGALQTRFLFREAVRETQSLNERGELVRAAIEMVSQHPRTGVGAGNFTLTLWHTAKGITMQPVHLVPLLLAAEAGLIAGLAWLWHWVAAGPRLARTWRLQEASTPRPWSVPVFSATLAWGLIGLWDSYPYALNAGLLMTGLLAGWAAWEMPRRTQGVAPALPSAP